MNYSNNAYSVLDGAITSAATAIQLAAGTGSRFPASDFRATLVSYDANGNESAWEIVHCSSRSGDVLTVTRGQEGTTAVAWPSGSRIENRITAGSMATLEPAITPGTTAQYLRGDKGWRDFFADVRAATLTGLSTATNAVITAGDTVLSALGKLQKQISDNLVSPSFTGNVVAKSSPESTGIAALSGTNPGFESRAQGNSGTAGAATITFHRPGAHAVHFGLDTDNKLKVGGWSLGANAYAIYHENNKPTKADVGLGNVDNTSDANKPISTATQTALDAKAPTATPTITGLREVRAALPANNIDLAAGNVFTKTISGATTLTVSNVPAAGTTASFILDLTNGGSAAITWWAGMKWGGGTVPTLTAAGRDVLGFFTHDGGTTWTGLVLGKDVK